MPGSGHVATRPWGLPLLALLVYCWAKVLALCHGGHGTEPEAVIKVAAEEGVGYFEIGSISWGSLGASSFHASYEQG